MKRWYFCARLRGWVAGALLLAGGTAAFGQDPSLILHLPFDEGKGDKASDVSGNNLHATLKGKANWGAGKFGGALKLNLNQYAEVPHDDKLNLQSMTLMCWVQIDQLTADNQSGIEKGASWAQGEYNLLPVYGGSVLLQAFDLPDVCDDKFPGGNVTDTEWHHIAGTFDGEDIRVYVDASQTGGGNCGAGGPHKMLANAEPLFIGCRGGGGRWTIGSYDEIRIYNRALTRPQIETAMNTPHEVRAVSPEGRLPITWAALKNDR